MKFVKLFLIILVALLVIFLLVAAVSPSSYDVERTVTIEKSKSEVFNYVKLLKNQDNYSKWAKIDPGMQKDFRGEDGTVGFVSAWTSDHPDVGKGEQEIVGMQEGSRIDYELRFIEPFESTSPAFMTTDSLDSTLTEVKWAFHGDMPYPMNIMLLFMDMEEMLGNDLAGGLENLKAILEKE